MRKSETGMEQQRSSETRSERFQNVKRVNKRHKECLPSEADGLDVAGGELIVHSHHLTVLVFRAVQQGAGIQRGVTAGKGQDPPFQLYVTDVNGSFSDVHERFPRTAGHELNKTETTHSELSTGTEAAALTQLLQGTKEITTKNRPLYQLKVQHVT
ncbi:uncharacterized protein V6R79_008371 [Siganus canaliculatus]